MPTYKLKPHINNEKLFKKLHIEEGTEVFKSASIIIDEIKEFIDVNMDISACFAEASINVAGLNDGCDKMCIICLVSSMDDINDFSREMMDNGNYLKGYLLYEAANHALFEASNKFSRFVREEACKNGHKPGKRIFAGDGIIDLNMQHEMLSILKKQEEIHVCINERHVLVPERSLLYLFETEDGGSECFIKHDDENACVYCKNKNCQYRDEK